MCTNYPNQLCNIIQGEFYAVNVIYHSKGKMLMYDNIRSSGEEEQQEQIRTIELKQETRRLSLIHTKSLGP